MHGTRDKYSNKSTKYQSQMQMQSKEQLQDQKYGNFTMATVLSTAENLTWRLIDKFPESLNYLELEYSKLNGYIPNKLIFNSYNSYNSGTQKSIDSLLNQFIFQIENFEDDFKEFELKYTHYSYPNNLSKNDINYLLDLWIRVLQYNNETKMYVKYFINLRNIFQNLPIESYESEVREKMKGNPRSGKADPRTLQREYCRAINEINKKTRDIDNQNIEKWK